MEKNLKITINLLTLLCLSANTFGMLPRLRAIAMSKKTLRTVPLALPAKLKPLSGAENIFSKQKKPNKLALMAAGFVLGGSSLYALSQEEPGTSQETDEYPKQPAEEKSSVVQMSQTDAYLSIPELKKRVDQEYGEDIERLKPLVDEILEKERSMSGDYYVFYHAQQLERRLMQDIITEYKRQSQGEELTDFVYLRSSQDISQKTQSVQEFLETTGVDKINDNNEFQRTNLVSVNLSLFGNSFSPGSCTFDYFLESRSIDKRSVDHLLHDLFSSNGFNSRYLPNMTKLYSALESKEGNLVQIFVPKGSIEKHVYLSQPLGVPYYLIEPRIYDAHISQGVKFSVGGYMQIKPFLELYKNNPVEIREACIKERISVEESIIQNALESKKEIDIITGLLSRHGLDETLLFNRSKRSSMECFTDLEAVDSSQARLVMPTGVLDPQSGIKMFQYSSVKPENLRLYKKDLQYYIRLMLFEKEFEQAHADAEYQQWKTGRQAKTKQARMLADFIAGGTSGLTVLRNAHA